jgi:hypothetical protein
MKGGAVRAHPLAGAPMDLSPLHLHLMLNHLPIYGPVFAAIVLGWGLARHSRDRVRFGLWLTVLLALATIPVDLTGEPAERQLRRFDPDVERRIIHEHEESSERGLYAILATGALAACGLWATRRRHGIHGDEFHTPLPLMTLGCLLVSLVLFAYAALLGGQIRHTELRAPSTVIPPGATPATAPNPT